jgi:integrase
MRDFAMPDLTFPMVTYGKLETRWDLRVLLYKGGAKGNSRTVFNQMAAGELGRPLVERLELVKRIHEAMTARLVGGGTKSTAFSTLRNLRGFFAWADEFEQGVSLETVEDSYRHWCDFLVNRVRLKAIENLTAYSAGLVVSSILGAALERSQPLILTTRLRRPKRGPRAVGIAADKQNLADTFAFGHLCLDIIDSLSLEAVYGPFPVTIRLRDDRMLIQWSGLREPTRVGGLQPGYKNKAYTRRILQLRADYEADLTLRTRFPLVNLRICAELMVFIAQTGMNLSQAHNLRRTQFSYRSTIDGYEVREFKNRRKGEVLFEIYDEYKTLFNAYLAWRDAVFGATTDRLFPFVRVYGALASTPPDFRRLRRSVCAPLGIPFVGPQMLRSTRVNWLLRQSRDPNLTAEMDQHATRTLLTVYEQPSLQVAQVEIAQFWQDNDPRLATDNPMPCPALGVCDGVPKPMPGLPPEAPKADCTQPAGCLFCEHHRDIDSEDYVWSMASMRFLNSVILQRFRPPAKGKADAAAHVELTLEVLTAKLKWFNESNATRKAWVEEATEKLAEGDFQIHWRYLIESAQGV